MDRPNDHRTEGRASRLRALLQVRDEEVGPLRWASLYTFSLLASNYVIRPLRDEMGVAGGTRDLPWLFVGTLAAMLASNALLGPAAARLPTDRLIVRIHRVMQAGLLIFFLLPRVIPPGGMTWIAHGFFVWASVSNLVTISAGWGSMADRFRSDQGRRLFGVIAAGGTMGAIVGSALTAALARRVGPLNLLPLAAAFLELGARAARRLLDPDGPGFGIIPEPKAADGPGRRSADPYLIGLAAAMLLYTATSALVYLEQARLVGAALSEPGARTALFARIDLGVNVLGLALQALATGRVIASLGLGATAALLPAVTLAGSVALAIRPSLATLVAFQVARRAVDYAIARPSREVMYTVVRRDDRYRAKALIDTAVYRLGDALGAGAFGLLPPGGTWRPVSLLVVPFSLAWLALCLWLGHRQDRLARARGIPGGMRSA